MAQNHNDEIVTLNLDADASLEKEALEKKNTSASTKNGRSSAKNKSHSAANKSAANKDAAPTKMASTFAKSVTTASTTYSSSTAVTYLDDANTVNTEKTAKAAKTTVTAKTLDAKTSQSKCTQVKETELKFDKQAALKFDKQATLKPEFKSDTQADLPKQTEQTEADLLSSKLAIETHEEVEDIGPHEYASLLAQCRKLHKKGWHKKIIELLEGISELRDSPELSLELGRAYNADANVDDIDAFLKVIELLSPHSEYFYDNFDWNFQLGYAYYYAEQEAISIPYFERAQELRPLDEDSHFFLVCAIESMTYQRFVHNYYERCQMLWDEFAKHSSRWLEELESTPKFAEFSKAQFEISNLLVPFFYHVRVRPERIKPQYWQISLGIMLTSSMMPLMDLFIQRMPRHLSKHWKFVIGYRQDSNLSIKFEHIQINPENILLKIVDLDQMSSLSFCSTSQSFIPLQTQVNVFDEKSAKSSSDSQSGVAQTEDDAAYVDTTAALYNDQMIVDFSQHNNSIYSSTANDSSTHLSKVNDSYASLVATPQSKSLLKSKTNAKPKLKRYGMLVYNDVLSQLCSQRTRTFSVTSYNKTGALVSRILRKICRSSGECTILHAFGNIRMIADKSYFDELNAPVITLDQLPETLKDLGFTLNLTCRQFMRYYAASTYRLKPNPDPYEFWRMDIFQGVSSVPMLCASFYSGDHELADLYHNTGMAVGYISYKLSEDDSPQTKVSRQRAAIQKELEKCLKQLPDLKILGHANGLYHDYVDVMFPGSIGQLLFQAQKFFKTHAVTSKAYFGPFRKDLPCVTFFDEPVQATSESEPKLQEQQYQQSKENPLQYQEQQLQSMQSMLTQDQQLQTQEAQYQLHQEHNASEHKEDAELNVLNQYSTEVVEQNMLNTVQQTLEASAPTSAKTKVRRVSKYDKSEQKQRGSRKTKVNSKKKVNLPEARDSFNAAYAKTTHKQDSLKQTDSSHDPNLENEDWGITAVVVEEPD